MDIEKSNIRTLAEWELQDAVILSLPHSKTDWCYMLDEIRQCYAELLKAMIGGSEDIILISPDAHDAEIFLRVNGIEGVKIVEIETNDTWVRDYGAISVVDGNGDAKLLDFKFNGWGLKFASCFDNLVNRGLCDAGVFSAPLVNQLNFVLEGGSIESDGQGAILTTTECLLSPNRNGGFTKSQIEQRLKALLGANRILWLNSGHLEGDDTDSHIDTLARFVSPTTIAYVKCNNSLDVHFKNLRAMEKELMALRNSDNEPYNLVALPFPDCILDEDGERLPATYANFLIMNDRVIVPTYRQHENDALALKIIGQLFDDKTIIGVDSLALIKQHGSIHCATMQFPQGYINKQLGDTL